MYPQLPLQVVNPCLFSNEKWVDFVHFLENRFLETQGTRAFRATAINKHIFFFSGLILTEQESYW